MAVLLTERKFTANSAGIAINTAIAYLKNKRTTRKKERKEKMNIVICEKCLKIMGCEIKKTKGVSNLPEILKRNCYGCSANLKDDICLTLRMLKNYPLPVKIKWEICPICSNYSEQEI